MIKRTLIATLLGLAVGSNAVLAQDTRTPVQGPDRHTQEQSMSSEQKEAARKQLDSYWATHNDNAPAYPFNP
jgi:hypothetical protein